MKTMTLNETLKLVKSERQPAISIFVGTNVTEKEGASRVRAKLRRLYLRIEAVLTKTHDQKRRERLLEPLRRALGTLRISRDPGGLAIYHSETFTGVVKIPTPVADLAVAADSFHIKPVLRAAQLRRTYHVLAFRRRAVDLLEVSADGVKRSEQFTLRVNTERQATGSEAGRQWFREELKIKRQRELKEAMKTLARLVDGHLSAAKTPLVLAGPYHLQEAYRSAAAHQYLVERGLVGQIDEMDAKTLGNLSTCIMEPYFAELDAEALRGFHKAVAVGRGATSLKQIAEAAARGQVQTLLVAEDRQVWGRLDRTTGTIQIEPHAGSSDVDDLLDDVAELVLTKGGRVVVVPSSEMPTPQPIAAIMRWTDRDPLQGKFQFLTRQSQAAQRAERSSLG